MLLAKKKPLTLYLLLCGLIVGVAEAVYLVRKTAWNLPGSEIAGLIVFSAILCGVIFLIIGLLSSLVPFLKFRSKKPGYLLVAAAVIVFITALILPAHQPPPVRTAQQKSGLINLILITLDTTSARHLSLYGYDRSTTPKLDSLAQRGVVFEQAITASPWTLASHATMFTGLYPSEHGATYRSQYLKHGHTTMAEMLARRGYHTAAFVGGPYCGSAFGMSQGFHYFDEQLGSLKLDLLAIKVIDKIWEILADRDHQDDLKHFISRFEGYPIIGKRPGSMINDRIGRYLDQADEQEPYFLFVNYFDPHQPYIVDPPYDALFSDDFCPSPSDSLELLNRAYTPYRHTYFGGEWGTAPDEFNDIAPLYQRLGRDTYDALIRQTDDFLNDLLSDLGNRGLLNNTLLVITADHGEATGEHRLWGHDGLYDEIVWVPLIFIGPGVPEQTRIDDQVSLHDLYPTVMALLGLEDAESKRDLSQLWGEDKPVWDQHAYAQFYRSEHLIDYHGDWFDCDQFMVRTPDWKVISHTNGVRRTYSLPQDPFELTDLTEELLPTALDSTLDRFADEALEAIENMKQIRISPEDQDRLRAVGYVQ